ncbi:hypothetical protein DL240_05755 [Lujinxingia litoralis]|uniref:Peptidase C-terminal archaeal/bacterial domain-containing protein n=2 Tax=Lujinxingia litoralis TaxID=2211119 RepID=A0A328C9J4_9DELT|nr:hypothetical protein DL240_05755 [Lujinxingia litoralis]
MLTGWALVAVACGDDDPQNVDLCEDVSCERGVCQAGECVNSDACTIAEDCVEGFICGEGGSCEETSCEGVSCERGQCSEATGQCENAPACAISTQATDCLEGFVCDENLCVSEDDFCANLGCEEGRGVCSLEERACVNAEVCEGSDRNCAEGFFCNDEDTCQANLCDDTTECSRGVCDPATGQCVDPEVCESGDDCTDGSYCIAGSCQPQDAACITCDGNQLCSYDAEGLAVICEENPAGCSSAIDCSDDRACQGGLCVDPVACEADALEPNDTTADATNIDDAAVEGLVSAGICSGDVDVFTFDTLGRGVVRGTLVVDVRALSEDRGLGDLEVSIFGTDGTELSRTLTDARGVASFARLRNAAQMGVHRIEVRDAGQVRDPGVRYQVFADVVPEAVHQVCQQAIVLENGASASGNSAESTSYQMQPTCADEGSTAGEQIFTFEVTERSRVDLMLTPSASVELTLSLRTTCESEFSELACQYAVGAGVIQRIRQTLDPGTYFAVVKGPSNATGGAFNIDLSIDPLVCSPGAASCLDNGTSRYCNALGTGFEEVTCLGGCVEESGLCEGNAGDTCVNAIDASAGFEGLIDWNDYSDEVSLEGGDVEAGESCLSAAEATRTFGPEVVYAVQIPAGHALQAELITTSDHTALLLLDDCADADLSCLAAQVETTARADGRVLQRLTYTNTSEVLENLRLVASSTITPTGDSEIRIETGAVVCEPGLAECSGDELVRCNAAGIALETERTCNFGCNPEGDAESSDDSATCNPGTNQVCRSAIDILSTGGTFQGVIEDYGNDYSPKSNGCTGRSAAGGDATFFVDASAGDVLTARLESDFDAAIWITTDCNRAAETCLSGSDSGVGAGELVQLVAPRDGRYFIIVDSQSGETGSFELEATLALPGCTPGEVLGCADADTLSYCGPQGAPANYACVAGCTGMSCDSPRGDACFDAIPVTDGQVVAGSFNARSTGVEIPGEVLGACDFSNSESRYDAGDPILGPQAIYSVALRAGQALEVTGVNDAYSGVYYILSECGQADTCLDNTTRGDNPELVHFAEQDETVFVVASRYIRHSSSSEGYVLNFKVVDITCEYGERRCMDSLTAEFCTAAGYWESYECLQGCSAGVCRNAPADTCTNAQVVTESSTFTGSMALMADDIDVSPKTSPNGCFAEYTSSLTTSGPDAIYEVHLAAGEHLEVRSSGTSHLLYLQSSCGAFDTCLVSNTGTSTSLQQQLSYTAQADEVLFVVLDTITSSSGDFEIYFGITPTDTGCTHGEAYCMADGETLAVCDAQGDYQAYRCTDGCIDGRCGTPDARICEDAVVLTPGQTYAGTLTGTGAVPLDAQATGACDFTEIIGEEEDYADWVTRVHAVDVRAGEVLSAKLRGRSSGAFMYITNDCYQGSAGCQAVSAEVGYAPELTYQANADETLYVVVSHTRDTSGGDYLLDVALSQPGCTPGAMECLADGRTLGMCNDQGTFDLYPCDGTCSQGACDQPVGDACFDAIPLIAGQPVTGTFQGTNTLSPTSGQEAGDCTFPANLPGNETIYSIFVPAGQALTVDLESSVYGSRAYILGDCADLNSCIAVATTDRDSQMNFVAQRDRTVFVVVDRTGQAIDDSEFTLTADYNTPECTPGQQRCSADGSSVQICNAFNYYEDYACASGSCSAGFCAHPDGMSCQDSLPLPLNQDVVLTQGPTSWLDSGLEDTGACSISGSNPRGEAYRHIDLEAGDVLDIVAPNARQFGVEMMVLEDCFTLTSCQVSDNLYSSSGGEVRYVADQARRVYLVIDDDGEWGTQTVHATVTPAECTPGEQRCDAESGNIQLCNELGIFEDDYQCDGACTEALTCATPKGDRCFDAIPLPGDGVAVSANNVGLSNQIGASSGTYGACTFESSSTGYDRIYSVEASAGDVLRVKYTTTETSSLFYVLSECGQIESCMANGHFRSGSHNTYIPIETDGTYYVVADRQSSSSSKTFDLEVEVMQPECVAYGITRCTPDGTGVEYCNELGVLEVTECQGTCSDDRCEVATGQTCGDAILLEPGVVYTGDFNGTNNLGDWGSDTGLCAFTEGNETHGADTFYEISLRADEVLLVDFTSEASEGMAYLVEDCRNIGTCLAQGDSARAAIERGFEYVADEDKTVFVVVDRRATSTSSSTYELSVSVSSLYSCTPGTHICSEDGSAIEYCDERGIERTYACADGCVDGRCATAEGNLCFDAIPVNDGDTVDHVLEGATNGFEFDASSSCYLTEDYGSVGPDRIYSIELNAGDRLDVDYEATNRYHYDDIVMYVLDDCSGSINEACQVASFGNWDLSFIAEESQTYFVVVDERRETPVADIGRSVSFHVTPASAGQVCLPGQSRCEGGTVSICNVEGTGFDTQVSCEFGCDRDFCAAPAQINDTCEDALLITAPTVLFDDFSEFSNDYGTYSNRCNGSSSSGRDAVYRVELAAGQVVRVRARSTANNVEPRVSIVEDCQNMDACLADDSGEPDAQTAYHSENGGTYFVVVDGDASSQDMYIVEFDIYDAACAHNQQACLDGTVLEYCNAAGLFDTLECPLGCGNDACNRPANNTCDGAIDAGDALSLSVELDAFTRDYDPALGSGYVCTGKEGTGPDMVYYVDALRNDVIDVTLTNADFWNMIWITTECSDSELMADACVIGDDARSGSSSSVSYRVPTAGRYFIVVDSYDSVLNEASGTVDIDIEVTRALCQPTEGFCDEAGNLNVCAADGSGFVTQTCATGCSEGACTPPVGNVCPDAVPMSSGQNFVGDFANYTPHFDPGYGGCTGFDAPGADAVFAVTLAAGESVTATAGNVADAANDLALYLISDCGDERASCQAGADTYGEGDETVVFTATEAGTYYLVVDSWNADASGQFQISTTIN